MLNLFIKWIIKINNKKNGYCKNNKKTIHFNLMNSKTNKLRQLCKKTKNKYKRQKAKRDLKKIKIILSRVISLIFYLCFLWLKS